MLSTTNTFRLGAVRIVLILILLLMACGIAAWFLFFQKNTKPEIAEYNVVLITFDTTKASHIGCYGAKFANTPNLNALAKTGTLFKNCFATNPITLPSHSSILTGLYPIRHGVHDNSLASLPQEIVTFPELMKEAGYATGAVVGAFPLTSEFGLSQGFDFYDDDMQEKERPSHMFLERTAGVVTEKALDWLNQLNGKKYFLWTHYFDPHADYLPPGVFEVAKTPAERFRFYNMEITYADSELGKLLAKIRELEKLSGRPTLIVMTADHGESLGQHRELTHGIFMYNATMHVPLIINDSMNPKQAETVDRLVSIADIFPTLAERLGFELPYQLDGLSLNQPITGDTDRTVYMESVMGTNAYGWSPLTGIIRGKEKFILAPRPEYYDLTSDFEEEKNLYEANPDQALELQDLLENLVETSKTLPTFEAEELKVDDAATRRLQSLGYISGGNRTTTESIDPKDVVDVHFKFLLAQDYISKKQFPSAIKVLKQALIQEPKNKKTIDSMSGLFARYPSLIEPSNAISFLKKLTTMAPKHGPLWFVLGVTHEQSGDRKSAQPFYEKSLELDPANQTALNYAAWNLYKLERDYEQALKWIDKAIRLGSNAHMLHTKACILIELDRPDEAEQVLQTAVTQKANFPVAYYHLGIAQQMLGKKAAAVLAFRKALAMASETDSWVADAKSRVDSIQTKD